MNKVFMGVCGLLLTQTAAFAEDKNPIINTTAAIQAQKETDANLFGHVIDKKTGEHLPFINIFVKGTTTGTATDASGHYFLSNLPAGNVTIQVKAVGYKTVEKQVTVKAHTNTELDFTLEQDDIALNEVVVSANREATQSRLAPNLVSVLTSRVFENTHAQCLVDGLSFQPGMRTEDDCQNCGFTQVRINGLDGHYSQILIDSRPVFSALAGVYGLEQIPASMIDRVEVVRGGGSALFGGSAIGGTVNIITKDPNHNSAELSHSITSIGGTNAFDNNTMLNASLVTDDRRAGVYIYGQSRYRQGYDHDGDGFTELPRMKNNVLGFRSYFKPTAYSRLTLDYHNIQDLHRGGDQLDRPQHEAQISEGAQHSVNGGGINYDLYSPDNANHLNTYFSFQRITRNSYYGGTGEYRYGVDTGTEAEEAFETAEKAYGRTNDMTYVAGAQYTHKFGKVLFMPSDLTLGAEYNSDNIHDVILGYQRDFRQDTHTASAFLQNEWKNEQWSILVGGRFDKHNLIDHVIFSPRVNLRYNPSQDINFRLSWAGGFRAPQAYDEDLHVGLVGGDRLVTVLAKNLKEERSNSFSASVDLYHTFGTVQTNLLIEGFYTDLNNIFALRTLSEHDSQGNMVQERYNGSGAKVLGLNIEGKAAFSSLFQIQAGITLQQSKYDRPEIWDEDAPAEKKMLRTPNTYGYFTATVTPVQRFNISLSGTYTGHMLVPHVAGSGVDSPVAVTTPTFFDANFKMAYDIPVSKGVTLQLNAGIQNFTNAYQKDFDKGWNRDSDYIYGPSLPRSYFAGCKITM